MTDATIAAWESELGSLLAELKNHPSRDHTSARERIAVLEKLIGDYHRNAAGAPTTSGT